MPAQQVPNYNNMYRQDTTPLVAAASPSMAQESFVPMAANEGIGGAFGGSSFW